MRIFKSGLGHPKYVLYSVPLANSCLFLEFQVKSPKNAKSLENTKTPKYILNTVLSAYLG